MSDTEVDERTEATVAEQRRVIAIQVASNRCEDFAQLLVFASQVEKYLEDGTVPPVTNSDPNPLDGPQ